MSMTANDLKKLQQAINIAKLETGKPSLIRVRTIIGYGSPKAGTKHVHGEALGKEAVRGRRRSSSASTRM